MNRRYILGLFAETIFLLILYAGVSLLGAVKFLADDPLAVSLPYNQVAALSNILLNLVIITGLIAGGLYIALQDRLTTPNTPLRAVFYAWSAFLVMDVAAGVLDLLDGQYMRELPLSLEAVQIILIIAFVGVVVRAIQQWDSVPLVWLVGMMILLGSAVIGVANPADPLQAGRIGALVVGIRFNVAYTLGALALTFWLMQRFSRVRYEWANGGLYNVAGMLALAGVLVTVAPLYALEGDALTRVVGTVGAIFTPLVYLIFASHVYRALSDRNETRTLATHWVALGMVLFLLGSGALGAIHAVEGINQWIQGTRLTDLRLTLVALAVVSVILGMVNHATAEIRADNQRITGLMPFWMVAFGILGASVALFGAGVVQVYMERILSVGYLETQDYMIPLYLFWIGGLMVAGLGVLVYALGFWARRPEA